MTKDNKLWGGRFSDDPNPQMRALNDSISFDQAMYTADIAGSIAYATELARVGIITQTESDQLVKGLNQVLAEFDSDSFQIIDGEDEDIHTAVERRLGQLIGDVAGKLHTGRSRNDQVATDIRLWLRETCEFIDTLLINIQQAIIAQSENHLDTLMPGYTHMQPAQPIVAAHWLMSFFWMLQRDRQRLADCSNRINLSPLGSSAFAGTPYPIDRERLAADLGFAGVTQNSMDAVADRDGIAEFLFVASMIGVHLSRLAEDVIFYSNPAFGFIKLPDAYSTGSSIMPQKRNADPMELARGKAGRMIGNLTGLLTTLKGLPSSYNKDLQEDKEPLFDTAETLAKILPVMAGMIRTIDLVPEKMVAALHSELLATELADWLVLEKNLPFRQAHHIIGQVVKLCEERSIAYVDLPLSDYQSISPAFDQSLYEVLDFKVAVSKRNATGGTSPKAVKQQIENAKSFL